MFSIIFWTAFTVGLVIFYAVVGFLASMCRVKWAIKHSPDWRYEDYKKHGDKKYLERAMESDDLRILYFTLWPIFGTGGCVYLIIRMFGDIFNIMSELQINFITSTDKTHNKDLKEVRR